MLHFNSASLRSLAQRKSKNQKHNKWKLQRKLKPPSTIIHKERKKQDIRILIIVGTVSATRYYYYFQRKSNLIIAKEIEREIEIVASNT